MMDLCMPLVVLLSCLTQFASSTKCFKDEIIGDRTSNVYYCEDPELPTCCVENEAPSCCIDDGVKNLEEQLQLWGTVGGVLLVLILIFVCVKNDVSFCTGETSLKERWTKWRNRNKSDKLAPLPEDKTKTGGYFDSPLVGLEHHTNHASRVLDPNNSRFQSDPYNFPPLPPATSKDDHYDPFPGGKRY